ncbi:MAG TPA: ABC transporter permease [Verrucomicrobiae bacterium]|nr:ABC transporter permease [Verrucomicrobiae bacterium]
MLLRIARKSLRQYALSTSITSLSIGLAGALLLSVWVIKDEARATFAQINGGFDAVLGARSTKLQLVLNAIFHLEASPANIELQDLEAIQGNPNVALAVPIAMGDNFRGFRVVGTSPEMFTQVEYARARKHKVRAPGRLFDPVLREAVVGSFAAQKLRLKRGDHFHPYHGLNFDEKHEHAEDYVVVGLLEPSNTPADKVIWIPLEGLQKMSGHAAKTQTDVSAVLVKLRSPMAGRTLDMQYNREGDRLTFAWPIGATISELLNKVGWLEQVLAAVAVMVGLVAAGSVMTTIYNSMNERRRQIAIFRALGARRSTVFLTVILEALSIAVIGVVVAFVLYGAIVGAASAIIRAQTGVLIDPWAWHNVMAWGPLGLIALGVAAGIVPAIKAYRVDVAEHLTT